MTTEAGEPIWDDASRAKLLENQARVKAVADDLRKTWPADAMRDIDMLTQQTELPLAISEACALARIHGYGNVRAEMLALANQFGEHDYTSESPHPLPHGVSESQ